MTNQYDPITLEIIQNSLQAAADEMFAAMRHTAMSAIIYEVLDMGTGITDRHGPDGARRGLAENERFLRAGGRGLVGIHAAFTCSDASLEAAAGPPGPFFPVSPGADATPRTRAATHAAAR